MFESVSTASADLCLRRMDMSTVRVTVVMVMVMMMIPWAGARPRLNEGGIGSEIVITDTPQAVGGSNVLGRNDFPDGFVFGTSSASYQYEGGVNDDGRGPSVWDTESHTPGRIDDNSTGDVAVDHYHRYQAYRVLGTKEDIGLMVDLGVDAYRFSISWTRIFPDGRGPAVNEEGVAYYNRLIDGLLAHGIEPYVCLYHFDFPQALYDTFGGWLSPLIVPLFSDYAEACFHAFGDRVKYWITFNEPHNAVYKKVDVGCKGPSGSCGPGDSRTQPYMTGHYILLSHAAAVEVYRTRFQAHQRGSIGIIMDLQWYEPMSDSVEDIDATERVQVFQVQWFLDPIYFGKYPAAMQDLIGDRLPVLSESESHAIKGSVDFIGINHYTTHYISNQPNSSTFSTVVDEYMDTRAIASQTKDGVPIGPLAGSVWMYIVPWGIQKILNYVRLRYNNPPIYITENGVDEDGSTSMEGCLEDNVRTQFYHDYLSYLIAGIRDGCDVRGYFVWSLLDNFEWESGISKRFGLYYVDYAHNLTRHPKSSVSWFKQLLQPHLHEKQHSI